MIYKERLLKVILASHVSEKVTFLAEKRNTIVLKVIKNATKIEIKTAVCNLFNVKVSYVRTLIIKGKIKKQKRGISSRRSDWKKAYVTLQDSQSVNSLLQKNKLVK